MVLNRYCIDDKVIYKNLTTTNTKNKLDDFLQKKTLEQILLTKEGLYKYVKDQLFKFNLDLSKINNTHAEKKEQILFGNNTYVFPTSYAWKKYDEMYSFPKIHSKINIETAFFKLNKKSNHTFVIEYINNTLNDFYFLSPESLDNHSLKEDINSFLAILN
jgi:hypothetical protein